MRCLSLIPLLLVLLPGTPIRGAAAEPGEVELIPAERAAWGPRNVFVAVSSALGRWNYWYGERELLVETVPAEAQIGLYYIRSNFQKRFERAVSPVRVKLPPRVDTTYRDNVKLHVTANGYQSKDVSFDSRQVPEALIVTLEPLPNALVFLGHTHLARRTTLTLRTSEEPKLSVTKSRRFNGFTLALSETGDRLETPSNVSGGKVDSLEVSQIGEDLVLRVKTTGPDFELRSKQGFDPIRSEHVFTLDLTDPGGRAPSDGAIRGELDATRFSSSEPCLTGFAQAFREGVDPKLFARTFRPSGSLADLYRRAAMKRLGRTNHGTVRTVSGETLRTGSPIELELALQSASSVVGYFELLVAYSGTQPDPRTTLRSLLAPELGVDEFDALYARAEQARAACH